MEIRNLSFLSDGIRIQAYLHLPGISSPPVVIGSHGLFSDGQSPKQIVLAEKLSSLGIAFLRLDHRGCGKSEGAFSEVTTLDGRVFDILHAMKWVRDQKELGNRIALFGSSFGGAVSIKTASLEEIAGFVTVAAPVRFDFKGAVQAIENAGESHIPDPAFFEKQLHFDISESIPKTHHILVFHGEDDNVVPLSQGMEIVSRAGRPHRLVVFPGGDHRISDPRHQKIFIEESVAWYVDLFK